MSNVSKKNLQQSLTARLSNRFPQEFLSDEDSHKPLFSSARHPGLFTSDRKTLKTSPYQSNDEVVSCDFNFVSSSKKPQITTFTEISDLSTIKQADSALTQSRRRMLYISTSSDSEDRNSLNLVQD